MTTLTPVESWWLGRFRNRGQELARATPLEILDHAIEEEATMRLLDPFDPARLRFAQMKIDLESFAVLQEKSLAQSKERIL